MVRQARDGNSCAEWERDWAGNAVKTEGVFVFTVWLLMKLDQKLWHEIRSYMEESETQLSEATQGPPGEQTADIKFRQMMALVPLRKVLPTIKSDLRQPERRSWTDHHRRDISKCVSAVFLSKHSTVRGGAVPNTTPTGS